MELEEERRNRGSPWETWQADQLRREIRKKCSSQWVRKINNTFAEEFELYSIDHKELPKISSKCSFMRGKFPFHLPSFCGWT